MGRLIKKLTASSAAFMLALAMPLSVFAVSLASSTQVGAVAPPGHTFEFTQDELDNNWGEDRAFPTDGVTSETAFGRDNVARIGLDSSQTAPGEFQRTEGIKTPPGLPADAAGNFGNAVQVDLYLDSDWQDQAVRAGFWVVGDDGAGDRDNNFGILEFVNNEPCPEPDCTNQANITDHEGWRYWTSADGWTNLATPFTYDEWVTLTIELDATTQEYKFYINDDEVATGPGGENFIREVFLNSYNYGQDEFPSLGSGNYAAHWHGGVAEQVSGEITAPTEGETVEDTLNLAANYTGDPEDEVLWAVRKDSCDAIPENNVFGNVGGLSDDYTWENGEFSASFDVATQASGQYCFIFNPGGNQNDVRETVLFQINQTKPADKADCKHGGWRDFGYKNQGQCIKDVVGNDDHGHHHKHHWWHWGWFDNWFSNWNWHKPFGWFNWSWRW